MLSNMSSNTYFLTILLWVPIDISEFNISFFNHGREPLRRHGRSIGIGVTHSSLHSASPSSVKTQLYVHSLMPPSQAFLCPHLHRLSSTVLWRITFTWSRGTWHATTWQALLKLLFIFRHNAIVISKTPIAQMPRMNQYRWFVMGNSLPHIFYVCA